MKRIRPETYEVIRKQLGGSRKRVAYKSLSGTKFMWHTEDLYNTVNIKMADMFPIWAGPGFNRRFILDYGWRTRELIREKY